MRVTMEQWEIERIKEKISAVLSLHHYTIIAAEDAHGGGTSMSKETFFESLERELKS